MPADANVRLRTLELQTGVMQIVRRKHRFWIWEIFKNRQKFGTFHTLVQEIRLHEREFSYEMLVK